MGFYYFISIPTLGPEETHQSNQVQLVRYLVQEGEAVTPGSPIAVVENFWVVLQIETTTNGFVSKIFFQPGTSIRIGDPIAIITGEGEDMPHNMPTAVIRVLKRKKIRT